MRTARKPTPKVNSYSCENAWAQTNVQRNNVRNNKYLQKRNPMRIKPPTDDVKN
jgi:hypothetical protein